MRVYSFLSKCLRILCVFTVGIVFILNFVYTATISYDAAEKVTIENHLVKSIFLLFIAAIALFAISFLKNYIVKIKEKYIFLALSAVYMLMAIYLISNVDHTLRADALKVSRAARELLTGTGASFEKGGYIYQYPHQIGLMLYDAFLYLFGENSVINFYANFVFVLGINWMIYKITDLIFQDRLANNIAIIMAFAFLPQFFFILFAYGTIPGLFFILFGFYHALCFCKNHRYLNLALTVAGSCTAVILRKNYLIGVLAIAIFLCLDMLKQFSFRHLALLVCISASLILPLKILPGVFVGGESGAPSVLWIAMGTDIHNNVRGPGWYDASNNRIYKASGYSAEISQEKGEEKLKNNLEEIKSHPLDACNFFLDKTVSQWCDPLYQSLWSGPLEDCGQQTKTPLLKALYTGKSAEDALSNGMKAYMLTFLGLSLVFVLKYHKNHDGWQLCFLMLIGGFLFYMFWEAKSQYVYPYFFSLIPFAAFSLSKIFIKIQSLAKAGTKSH